VSPRPRGACPASRPAPRISNSRPHSPGFQAPRAEPDLLPPNSKAHAASPPVSQQFKLPPGCPASQSWLSMSFSHDKLTACHSADGLSSASLAPQGACGEVRPADVAC
jgi:hypothetical protein